MIGFSCCHGCWLMRQRAPQRRERTNDRRSDWRGGVVKDEREKQAWERSRKTNAGSLKSSHKQWLVGQVGRWINGLVGQNKCIFMLYLICPLGLSASSQPAQQQLENSQPSSMDVSPHPSPQSSLSPQRSGSTSESPAEQCCSSGSGTAPQSAPQETSTKGEEDVAMAEPKETRTNRKLLHCPTCKVTVNSSSQLESHCSGAYLNTTECYNVWFTWLFYLEGPV